MGLIAVNIIGLIMFILAIVMCVLAEAFRTSLHRKRSENPSPKVFSNFAEF